MPKVTIVGAGNVGSAAALAIAESGLADIVLVDIVKGVPQGKALDIAQALSVIGSDASVSGSNDYSSSANSDIVVICAGVPRKPGMSRDDLVAVNAKIVKEVTLNVVKHSPMTKLIVVSNPVDAMVFVAKEVSGLPKTCVMGMAGCLDTARFKRFVADELGVSVKSITTMVLGSHGDTMIPLIRLTSVNGIPLSDFLDSVAIDRLIERTRNGGGEFLPLLTTSAWVGPGYSIFQMVKAILLDTKEVLPVACLLWGEYGQKGIFIGVPCILGAGGVERVIEIKLTHQEQAQFDATASKVRELLETTKKIM